MYFINFCKYDTSLRTCIIKYLPIFIICLWLFSYHVASLGYSIIKCQCFLYHETFLWNCIVYLLNIFDFLILNLIKLLFIIFIYIYCYCVLGFCVIKVVCIIFLNIRSLWGNIIFILKTIYQLYIRSLRYYIVFSIINLSHLRIW